MVTLPVGSKPSVRERGKKPTWKIKRDTKAKKGPSQPSPAQEEHGVRSMQGRERELLTGRLAGGVGERRNVGSLRGENKESGKGRGGKEEKIVD